MFQLKYKVGAVITFFLSTIRIENALLPKNVEENSLQQLFKLSGFIP